MQSFSHLDYLPPPPTQIGAVSSCRIFDILRYLTVTIPRQTYPYRVILRKEKPIKIPPDSSFSPPATLPDWHKKIDLFSLCLGKPT